jgi:hypothetical protein
MITKRQLGIVVVALGLLVVFGTLGIDLIGAGQWGGFLIRLGDRPA